MGFNVYGQEITASIDATSRCNLWLYLRDSTLIGILNLPLDPPRVLSNSQRTFGPIEVSMSNKRVRGVLRHTRSIRVDAPIWLPFALVGLYPFFAFVRGPVRRKRRRLRGQCVECGYSLYGHPDEYFENRGERITQAAQNDLAIGRGRTLTWAIRGALFGALSPAVWFFCRILFPESSLLRESIPIRTFVFPAFFFPFNGVVVAYIVNILLVSFVCSGFSHVATYFRAPSALSLELARERKSESNDSAFRCPECGSP